MKMILIIVILAATLPSCANKRMGSIKERSRMGDNLIPGGETMNLATPESVAFHKKHNILFVSLQAGADAGDGSIAKLSLNGKIIKTKFAVGLNDPKGIAIANNKLYVGDIKELVEIDIETGAVLKKYTDEKVKFLNDVTADANGNVYVSDMFTSSIYKLNNKNEFTEWITSPMLENPNGLLAVGNEIYLAGWGNFTDGRPLFAPKGRFQKIDIATQNITRITQEPLGNLDGVQVKDKNSFFVSDWRLGKLFTVSKTGQTIELLNLGRGMGDILFIPEKRLLALPMKLDNKVVFYKID